MGLSVGPRTGPDYLLVGDAGGSINPFNGEGIAYGYETGRLGATVVHEVLNGAGFAHLDSYESELDRRYGLYYKTASKFMGVMGHPEIMRRLVSTGMHSQTIMEWLLRIMSNLLRDDERAPAELAYKALAALAQRRPERVS